MPDPCVSCPRLRFCETHDISPLDCKLMDFNEVENDGVEFEDDDELANTAPWNIVDYRCTENILDYGDTDDIVEEDK